MYVYDSVHLLAKRHVSDKVMLSSEEIKSVTLSFFG